jgi:hypothetical protein
VSWHRLMAATARHRRVIVCLDLLLLVCLVVLEARRAEIVRTLFPWEVVLVLAGIALAIVSIGYRPALLEVAPDGASFGTPASPAWVCLLIAYLFPAASFIGRNLREIGDREELWQLDAVMMVLYLAAFSLLVRAAWINPGVQLRPDGVVHRSLVGSLYVPWEAFALDQPAYPGGKVGQVVFAYQRAELVRRRGLPRHPRLRAVTGIDVWFLSRVIHHYVTQPAHRAAIGTDAEYRRLRLTPGLG